jgi:pimeloyl-ACP methyl ester carboxylesterase
VIAPSRFGYLGSALPPGATPAGQADAFAALLDALGIARTDVAAFSAGAISALQFALRHPGRVNHLVVISGYWPGGPTARTTLQANRLLVRSEFPMWALRTFAGPLLARMAGVPKGFPRTAADARIVTDLTGTFFPVVPRAEGVIFDWFVSFPDVNHYDLEQVTVPVLIIHAADDPAAPYEAAQQAAGRIPPRPPAPRGQRRPPHARTARNRQARTRRLPGNASTAGNPPGAGIEARQRQALGLAHGTPALIRAGSDGPRAGRTPRPAPSSRP